MDAVAIRQLWPAVLDTMKRGKQRTRALLQNAQVAEVDGDLITLTAPSATAGADDQRGQQRRGPPVGVAGRSRGRLANCGPGAGRAAAGVDAGPAGRGIAALAPAETDPRDDTDFSAASPAPADPEADALDLLQARLGARPVES